MANVITIGEILQRLTPINKQKITQGNLFSSYFGGAEANVAVALSRFGHDVSYFTALPINDLGDAANLNLQRVGVDTSLIVRNEERLGIYYYEEGFSVRPPKVIYDRKHSSVLHLDVGSVNWNKIYETKEVLHISGITPALSEEMKELTLTAVKEAKKRDIQVSFDFNYRSKLWSIQEARETYVKILPYVDICFAGHKDLAVFLDMGELETFNPILLEKHYQNLAKSYHINILASTYRKIISPSKNELTGFIYNSGKFYKSDCVSFEILDRIGGGDAFAAGILHGILTNMDLQETIHFGVASSVLKHAVNGDSIEFSTDEVFDLLANRDKDVRR